MLQMATLNLYYRQMEHYSCIQFDKRKIVMHGNTHRPISNGQLTHERGIMFDTHESQFKCQNDTEDRAMPES